MKANKTQPSEKSVEEYINSIADIDRRHDAALLMDYLVQSTKAVPMMWGSSIVGFGTHHYHYETGREGDIAAIGFAARKHSLAVYGIRTNKNIPLLQEMGLSQESKGCVYIKDVEQIDKSVLCQAFVNAYLERNS